MQIGQKVRMKICISFFSIISDNARKNKIKISKFNFFETLFLGPDGKHLTTLYIYPLLSYYLPKMKIMYQSILFGKHYTVVGYDVHYKISSCQINLNLGESDNNLRNCTHDEIITIQYLTYLVQIFCIVITIVVGFVKSKRSRFTLL